MGSQKTLTNEKFKYSNKEFQIYKTKKGAKLIKINNNYVNINDASIISKINNKQCNDIVEENINELNNLDINDTTDIKVNINDINDTIDTIDTIDINDSIDGEEYIII
jgi:hypothetical protein